MEVGPQIFLKFLIWPPSGVFFWVLISGATPVFKGFFMGGQWGVGVDSKRPVFPGVTTALKRKGGEMEKWKF